VEESRGSAVKRMGEIGGGIIKERGKEGKRE
jgi:hypothetical protein